MKIIQLADPLHDYLVHLIEAHAARGIHPEEGMAVSRLWDCVTNRATTIPDTEIERMAAAGTAIGQSNVPVEASFRSELNEESPYDPL